jgi:hypothetical protein
MLLFLVEQGHLLSPHIISLFCLPSKLKKETMKWARINRHWLWLDDHRRLNNHGWIIRGNSIVSKMWIHGSVVIVKTKTMSSLNS